LPSSLRGKSCGLTVSIAKPDCKAVSTFEYDEVQTDRINNEKGFAEELHIEMDKKVIQHHDEGRHDPEKLKSKQAGFIDSDTLLGLAVILIIPALIFSALFVRFQSSNSVVSGIAYNTSNDSLFGGNTHFSVRAGENTPVTAENESTYCLPPNSPYKDLVNKAAQDKRIKIVVTADKYFAIQAPWVCNPNVTVTEVK